MFSLKGKKTNRLRTRISQAGWDASSP